MEREVEEQFVVLILNLKLLYIKYYFLNFTPLNTLCVCNKNVGLLVLHRLEGKSISFYRHSVKTMVKVNVVKFWGTEAAWVFVV